MFATAWPLLVGVAATVLGGALALRTKPLAERPSGRRIARTQAHLIGDLGRWGAAASVLAAGAALTVAVCWPLGVFARGLQARVDEPVWSHFFALMKQFRGWTRINEVLTQMGDRPQIKVVAVVAAVALGVLWRRRAWWLPGLAIAVAFVAEKYMQMLLGRAVGRGPSPLNGGTYPSGGVGRILCVYGVILALVMLTFAWSRSQRIVAWTVLAVMAVVEAYTRVYLVKHWFTDSVAGLVFGGLLLVTLVAATRTLAGGPVPVAESEAALVDVRR